jgi:hypothetical protein
MAITVCRESSHGNQPINYPDDIARDFIELLFGMDFDEFAIKFEAYALFRIKGKYASVCFLMYKLLTIQFKGVAKNSNEHKTMTKRIVCTMVQWGLCM